MTTDCGHIWMDVTSEYLHTDPVNPVDRCVMCGIIDAGPRQLTAIECRHAILIQYQGVTVAEIRINDIEDGNAHDDGVPDHLTLDVDMMTVFDTHRRPNITTSLNVHSVSFMDEDLI
jgi:hypothetical protein